MPRKTLRSASASPTPPSNSLSSSKHSVIFRVFIATRPWSFLATIGGMLVGVALGYNKNGFLKIGEFFFSILGALAVHCAGNLTNTYFDFRLGLDKKKSSADRGLVDGLVTSQQVLALMGFSYLLALAAAGYFLHRFADQGHHEQVVALLTLVGAGIALAHMYTASPFKLKYRGLGDFVIFLAFGPLLVEGAYFTQTGSLIPLPVPLFSSTSSLALLLSVPTGLVTEGILHVNNTRDVVADRRANALTLPQLLGPQGSFLLYIALLSVSYLTVALFAWICRSLLLLLPFLVLPFAVHLVACFAKAHWRDLCEKNGQFSFLFNVLLSLGILLTADTACLQL